MTNKKELEFMKHAVAVARKCISEGERISPKVGAVVVKDGIELATAFRGEIEPGEHAEYTALEKKLKTDTLAGCTVYTTLEPCTDRNPPKLSCSERLKDRKVGRVVIGMLDPNQSIRGKGIIELRKAGIEIGFFPNELMTELEELNRDFIRDQEKYEKSNQLLSEKAPATQTNKEELRAKTTEINELRGKYSKLLNEYTELKQNLNEDLHIEESIIALCSPHEDIRFEKIFEALGHYKTDKKSRIKVIRAIGRLKQKGRVYNFLSSYADSIRLKETF